MVFFISPLTDDDPQIGWVPGYNANRHFAFITSFGNKRETIN